VTVLFSPTVAQTNPMVGQSYSGNANVASNATSGSGVRPVSGAAVVPVTTMLDVNGGSFPRTTVSSFKIGKFEVTWDEWKAVRGWAVAYGGYSDLANVGDGIGRNTAVTDEDAYGSYPVTKVSWCDVVKWCNAKSRLLLDFSRGAQRVSPIRRLYELEAPPVCCGLMGRVRESRPVSTRPRRPCPPFPLQSPISKGQWYDLLC